jgi:hypothetical protein
MSMPSLPDAGQDPWDVALNTYLTALESRITAVENKPEHVYNSYAWQFSNAAPPATGSQLRLNNTNPVLATLIDVRKVDLDGADRTPVFLQVTPDDIIRINDWDNAANLHRYTVTGTPTMDATNVQIPVAWDSGSGVIPTTGQAKINVAFYLAIIL